MMRATSPTNRELALIRAAARLRDRLERARGFGRSARKAEALVALVVTEAARAGARRALR